MADCLSRTHPSTSSDSPHSPDRPPSRGRTINRVFCTSTRNKRRKLDDDTDNALEIYDQSSKAVKMDAPALPYPSVSSRYSSPIGSRKRSISPAKQLRNLESASPRLNFLDRTKMATGPMLELRTKIVRATQTAYLPRQLRSLFDDQHLVEFEHPETLFSYGLIGAMSPRTLQSRIRTIMIKADRCATRGRDEAMWSQCVQATLELALELEDTRLDEQRDFEVLDVRNQMPMNQFLPRLSRNEERNIAAKKTDFALGFDLGTSRVKALQDMAQSSGSHESLLLSHSVDFETSSIPLQCAVEVKREDGGHLEARTQLATWHAAAILHARHLLKEDRPEAEDLPQAAFQVGWLVVGHRWELYFTGQIESDQLTCFGPIASTEMGTMNIVALFRLMATQRTLLRWLTTEYWNAFDDLFRRAVASGMD
ncbi:hypothetical protein MBLNU459_g2789t1 [Dothideomycetes sp. NU459]